MSKSKSLLDERIEKYNIPIGSLRKLGWPSFDRVICYQIEDDLVQEKIGSIYVPETSQQTREGSKRMVLVAAGLTALDELRSHGIDLGHIVCQVQFGDIDYAVEKKEGGALVRFRVLRAADIVASEDLLDKLQSGDVEITYDNGKHKYKMATLNGSSPFPIKGVSNGR